MRKYIDAISVYDRPCAFRDEKCFHAEGPFFGIKPFFTLKRLVSSLLQKKDYRRNTCTCWVPFIKFEMTRISRNSRICPDMTSRYPSSARVYIGKYLQLQHAVSIPEKISICLNRGHEESMDYYYTLRAEATSNFFLQLKLECSSTCRSPAHTAKM